MENYTRIRAKKKDDLPMADNEIRVVAANKMRNYVVYALKLLQEKGHKVIVLKAMGRAIEKTETIAEIIKRRVAGVHQITENESMDIIDEWEPKEEGLSKLEITRQVPLISLTLSVDPLDSTHAGYKAPIAAEMVKNVPIEDIENGTDDLDGLDDGSGRDRDRRRPRRDRRGPPRAVGEGGVAAEGIGADGGAAPRGEGRSRRGRGRGRGGRGGGEGGEGAVAEGGEGGEVAAAGGGGRGRNRRRGGGRGRGQAGEGGEGAPAIATAHAEAPAA